MLKQQEFMVPGMIKQLYSSVFSKTHMQHVKGQKKENQGTLQHCISLVKVLHPPVKSLCFYISVIGSHKSLMNIWLCQKDVHFTAWSLCSFARQQS